MLPSQRLSKPFLNLNYRENIFFPLEQFSFPSQTKKNNSLKNISKPKLQGTILFPNQTKGNLLQKAKKKTFIKKFSLAQFRFPGQNPFLFPLFSRRRSSRGRGSSRTKEICSSPFWRFSSALSGEAGVAGFSKEKSANLFA